MNNKLRLTDVRLFYCLKHFKKINKTVQQYLKEKGYTTNEIKEQTEIVGSKFLSNFCTSPHDIVTKIVDRVPTKIIHQENGNIVYSYLFEENIGIDSIILIDKLSTKEKTLITIEQRNKHEIKTISKNKRNYTKQLNVIFQKNNYEIITLFPGMYAPPFPSETMKNEELKTSIDFWSNHIFII